MLALYQLIAQGGSGWARFRSARVYPDQLITSFAWHRLVPLGSKITSGSKERLYLFSQLGKIHKIQTKNNFFLGPIDKSFDHGARHEEADA